MVIKFLITTLVVFGAAYYMPGINMHGIATALLVAALWGIASVTIKPVLNLVSLPVQILTLGLFGIVINIGILFLIDYFVPGFHIANIASAIVLVLLISIVNIIVNLFE